MKVLLKKYFFTIRFFSTGIICLLLIHSITLYSQTPTKNKVTGTVTDVQGTPLIGVNVTIDGTNQGTVTDIDGKFNIEISSLKAKITFSYLGYITQTSTANSSTILNIILTEDTKQLDEVIVVGYGTQRKKDLTGAISVVNTKNLEKQHAVNLGSALQGQVSGMSVTTSGEPGSSADIKIRGIGSFSNLGPLYVIDGMIINGSQREFNVNDIESVQVLKDASATALYGARGANGVIVITTKKGKSGPAKFDFSLNYGISQIAKK